VDNLILTETERGYRINLAYIQHEIKNPAFEAKHKRGFHGHFGSMFKMPKYFNKKLKIGAPAGGSNGAKWATPSAHPLHMEPTSTKTEAFGKGGKPIPHSIQHDWEHTWGGSKRGHLLIKEDKKDHVHKLIDNSAGTYEKQKVIGEFDTHDAAEQRANSILAEMGHAPLAPYALPPDVNVNEPDSKGIESAGMLLREPDGRIWLREPSNHFGGYEHTFAKGHKDPGESLQQAAHRELYEETGLKGKIAGYLGDYDGDTTTTRMYIADRTGNDGPVSNPETWGFKLVPPNEAHKLLNRGRDKGILSDYSPHPDERWLLKHYNGNEDRVATELLANAIYRAMDVPVPRAGSIEHQGRTALTYPAADGTINKIKPSETLGKNFMVDALLANWDVIGLTDDNILWTDKGPMRLDQGGTLSFRAQGATKPFGSTPGEVWSMMEGGGQAKGKMIVTPLQKREQATKIAKRLTPDAIDHLVDQAPYEDLALRENVRQALKDRVEWMKQFGRGLINEKQDALSHDDQVKAFEGKLQDDIEDSLTEAQMAGLVDKALQPTKDDDELFEMANHALHGFKFLLDMGVGVEQDIGAKVHDVSSAESSKVGFKAAMEYVASHKNDNHIVIAPNKTYDAAFEKVSSDKNNGDWSKITDLVRATVLVPHPANIADALRSVMKHAEERGWNITEMESKLYEDKRRPGVGGATKAGYRDLAIRLETDTGFQIELQFNWNEMFLAKNGQGHAMYEEQRSMERKPGGPTKEDEDKVEALDAKMKALYNGVWEKIVGFDQLPDKPSDYFKTDSKSKMVNVRDLKSTKPDDEVRTRVPAAEKRMRDAAAGKIEKRAPLKVAKRDDGRYDVIDGNATHAAAKKHGFSKVPVTIVPAEKGK